MARQSMSGLNASKFNLGMHIGAGEQLGDNHEDLGRLLKLEESGWSYLSFGKEHEENMEVDTLTKTLCESRSIPIQFVVGIRGSGKSQILRTVASKIAVRSKKDTKWTNIPIHFSMQNVQGDRQTLGWENFERKIRTLMPSALRQAVEHEIYTPEDGISAEVAETELSEAMEAKGFFETLGVYFEKKNLQFTLLADDFDKMGDTMVRNFFVESQQNLTNLLQFTKFVPSITVHMLEELKQEREDGTNYIFSSVGGANSTIAKDLSSCTDEDVQDFINRRLQHMKPEGNGWTFDPAKQHFPNIAKFIQESGAVDVSKMKELGIIHPLIVKLMLHRDDTTPVPRDLLRVVEHILNQREDPTRATLPSILSDLNELELNQFLDEFSASLGGANAPKLREEAAESANNDINTWLESPGGMRLLKEWLRLNPQTEYSGDVAQLSPSKSEQNLALHLDRGLHEFKPPGGKGVRQHFFKNMVSSPFWQHLRWMLTDWGDRSDIYDRDVLIEMLSKSMILAAVRTFSTHENDLIEAHLSSISSQKTGDVQDHEEAPPSVDGINEKGSLDNDASGEPSSAQSPETNDTHPVTLPGADEPPHHPLEPYPRRPNSTLTPTLIAMAKSLLADGFSPEKLEHELNISLEDLELDEPTANPSTLPVDIEFQDLTEEEKNAPYVPSQTLMEEPSKEKSNAERVNELLNGATCPDSWFTRLVQRLLDKGLFPDRDQVQLKERFSMELLQSVSIFLVDPEGEEEAKTWRYMHLTKDGEESDKEAHNAVVDLFNDFTRAEANSYGLRLIAFMYNTVPLAFNLGDGLCIPLSACGPTGDTLYGRLGVTGHPKQARSNDPEVHPQISEHWDRLRRLFSVSMDTIDCLLEAETWDPTFHLFLDQIVRHTRSRNLGVPHQLRRFLHRAYVWDVPIDHVVLTVQKYRDNGEGAYGQLRQFMINYEKAPPQHDVTTFTVTVVPKKHEGAWASCMAYILRVLQAKKDVDEDLIDAWNNIWLSEIRIAAPPSVTELAEATQLSVEWDPGDEFGMESRSTLHSTLPEFESRYDRVRILIDGNLGDFGATIEDVEHTCLSCDMGGLGNRISIYQLAEIVQQNYAEEYLEKKREQMSLWLQQLTQLGVSIDESNLSKTITNVVNAMDNYKPNLPGLTLERFVLEVITSTIDPSGDSNVGELKKEIESLSKLSHIMCEDHMAPYALEELPYSHLFISSGDMLTPRIGLATRPASQGFWIAWG